MLMRKSLAGSKNTTIGYQRVKRDGIFATLFCKVKSMQRSGKEALKTQIQPSKPKREITKITNSQNTKRTCSQPSEQLFP